jgi:hypothetical protein
VREVFVMPNANDPVARVYAALNGMLGTLAAAVVDLPPDERDACLAMLEDDYRHAK